MNERELTSTALNKLEFHTGLIAKISQSSDLFDTLKCSEARVEFQGSKSQLVAQIAELKNAGSDFGSTSLLRDLVRTPPELKPKSRLIISDFINDDLAQRLRENNINYLDKAGNAYLDIAPIYILIQGKVPIEAVGLDKIGRLFTETGLKVIFALLSNQDLLNANYREIADHAMVSMGTIGWVLRGLKEQKYTQELAGHRSWQNRSRLIKVWADEYPKLKVKHDLGRYISENKDWWQSLELEPYEAVLGGEVAAISYSDHAKPRSGLIYVGKHKQEKLIRDLKLVPALDGQPANIEIRSRFWGQVENLSILGNSTHPLITYADLIDTWDPISRGVAAQIAEKYLWA